MSHEELRQALSDLELKFNNKKEEFEAEIEKCCENEDYDRAAELEEQMTSFETETKAENERIKELLAVPERQSSFATFMHVSKIKRGEETTTSLEAEQPADAQQEVEESKENADNDKKDAEDDEDAQRQVSGDDLMDTRGKDFDFVTRQETIKRVYAVEHSTNATDPVLQKSETREIIDNLTDDDPDKNAEEFAKKERFIEESTIDLPHESVEATAVTHDQEE